MNQKEFFRDLWAERADGTRVYPYKGIQGDKKGLYSVNFTSDNTKFEGFTESQLIDAVESGQFAKRCSIRMLPLKAEMGDQHNAYTPTHYKGQPIQKD